MKFLSADASRTAVDLPSEEPGDDGEEIRLSPAFLDRFELKRLLGAGGAGRVYLATDRNTGLDVAIKFLLAAEEPDVQRRFRREAELLEKVRDPYVVGLVEVGQVADSTPYLVSDYVPGGTLRTLLRSPNPPGLREALGLALDILSGLSALHRFGVVHRDLKPENVLIENDGSRFARGRARIADLGLAREERGDATVLTATGAILGTPRYMSPEQARGEKCTPASDIYSAGVMLYELCCGRLPFESANAFDLMRMHVDAQPEPLRARAPAVPPALEAMVMRALAKAPADRPRDAASMAAVVRDAVRQLDARAIARRSWQNAAIVTAGIAAFFLVPSPPTMDLYWQRGETLLALGRPAEALEPLERARSLLDATRPGDLPRRAGLCTSIGHAHAQLGHVPEARAALREAIAAHDRSTRNGRIDLSVTLGEAAALELGAGKPGDALPLHRECLELREAELPPDHVLVAEAQAALGKALVLSGDATKGEVLLRKTLASFEKGRAEETFVMGAYNVLAYLEAQQQDYPHSLEHYQKALAIGVARMPPDHPDLAALLANTADAYVRLGDARTALELFDRALGIVARSGNADGPLAARLLANQANAQLLAGRTAEAERNLARAALLLQRQGAGDSPVIANVLYNQGRACVALHRDGHDPALAAKAESLLAGALAIQERALSPLHPDRLQTMACLAYARLAADRPAEAEPLLSALLDKPEDAFGPAHAAFVHNIEEIGTICERRGDAAHALALYRRCAALSRRIFGASDERTAVASARVAQLERDVAGKAAR